MKVNFCFLVFMSFCIFIVQTFGSDTPVAKVIYAKGKVSGDKANQKISKGYELKLGDRIKTAEKSFVVLAFGEGFSSKMKIDQKSSIVIDESYTKKHKKPELDIFVKAGGVVISYLRRPNSKTLKVRTKSSSIGVRGTTFFVYKNDESSYLNVKEGKVRFTSDETKSYVDVAESESSLLNKKSEVLKSRKMKWSNKINWNFEGNIEQPQDLFLSMRQAYDTYKDEQEYRFESYKQDNFQKFEEWKKEFNSATFP